MGKRMGTAKGKLAKAKEDLARACRALHKHGLMEGFGHVSLRNQDTETFLISRRVSPALVTASDIITMNLEGEKVEGPGEPNSESFIHSSIYQARQDIFSVVHTHSRMVITLGICGKSITSRHQFGAMFLHTPLYAPAGLIVTQEIGKSAADKLGQHRAVLLRGHGAVVVGESLEAACLGAIYLEEAAYFQVYSSLLGGGIDLTEEECSLLKEQILNPRRVKRAWEYYTHGI